MRSSADRQAAAHTVSEDRVLEDCEKMRTVMNCQTKPSLPSSHTYDFMSSVLRPAASQLKDGLRL